MLEKILVKEVIGPIVVILSCLLIYHLIKKIINKMMKVKLSRIDQRCQKTINVLIIINKILFNSSSNYNNTINAWRKYECCSCILRSCWSGCDFSLAIRN
ncbi:MAG: hypothetical protein V8Q71_01265 [Bacilli bacterium]